ncbi:hypothetical protein BDZ94DRAFT_100777 [Collybia nuda]|uniref:Uncharacterized protein n=1 Tax=Collybia nuda TaxID=64659 RepID=A0A9P6CAN4_9AGAR|nr:hypothetical protein BDZ94DRAFT_100777 [Collybia nuda]
MPLDRKEVVRWDILVYHLVSIFFFFVIMFCVDCFDFFFRCYFRRNTMRPRVVLDFFFPACEYQEPPQKLRITKSNIKFFYTIEDSTLQPSSISGFPIKNTSLRPYFPETNFLDELLFPNEPRFASSFSKPTHLRSPISPFQYLDRIRTGSTFRKKKKISIHVSFTQRKLTNKPHTHTPHGHTMFPKTLCFEFPLIYFPVLK